MSRERIDTRRNIIRLLEDRADGLREADIVALLSKEERKPVEADIHSGVCELSEQGLLSIEDDRYFLLRPDTVRVKVCIGVDGAGDWYATGNCGDDVQVIWECMMDSVSPHMHYYFIEVDVPIPRPTNLNLPQSEAGQLKAEIGSLKREIRALSHALAKKPVPPVEPSTNGEHHESRQGRPKGKIWPEYRKRIFEYIAANGPQSQSGLHRALGIPRGSLNPVLNHEWFVELPDQRWDLVSGERIDGVLGKRLSDRMYEFIRDYGPEKPRAIAETLDATEKDVIKIVNDDGRFRRGPDGIEIEGEEEET